MSESTSKVTVYGADWCPPCHATKAYLKSRGVDYEYINIDENPEAGQAVAARTGWRAIPIIKIADEYILGFDRPKIDSALTSNKLA